MGGDPERTSSAGHREALLDYDQALRLKPAFALAHYNRAVSAKALERFAEAEADYSRALEALRPYPRARLARAELRARQKNLEAAIIAFVTATVFFWLPQIFSDSCHAMPEGDFECRADAGDENFKHKAIAPHFTHKLYQAYSCPP